MDQGYNVPASIIIVIIFFFPFQHSMPVI